jgi:hypothetical protein
MPAIFLDSTTCSLERATPSETLQQIRLIFFKSSVSHKKYSRNKIILLIMRGGRDCSKGRRASVGLQNKKKKKKCQQKACHNRSGILEANYFSKGGGRIP